MSDKNPMWSGGMTGWRGLGLIAWVSWTAWRVESIYSAHVGTQFWDPIKHAYYVGTWSRFSTSQLFFQALVFPLMLLLLLHLVILPWWRGGIPGWQRVWVVAWLAWAAWRAWAINADVEYENSTWEGDPIGILLLQAGLLPLVVLLLVRWVNKGFTAR